MQSVLSSSLTSNVHIRRFGRAMECRIRSLVVMEVDGNLRSLSVLVEAIRGCLEGGLFGRTPQRCDNHLLQLLIGINGTLVAECFALFLENSSGHFEKLSQPFGHKKI